MYIKTICPTCGESSYHDLLIHRRETICAGVSSKRVVDVEIVDTCTAQELSHAVLKALSGYVYNGISTRELCRILKDKFRILERYCCDIVQRLKIELDMYCPDGEHLCFV